ncbi:MAG: LysR family transcriptional regulator [Pseudomonadota bacterium]
MIEMFDVRMTAQIAKSGSIHMAAQEVGLTQPALTKRLQAMEERLGFQVFHRMPRGVKLTRLGELFLLRGEDLLLHAKDITADINRVKLGEEGSLRIGVKPIIQSTFFRRSLISFATKHPGVQLKIDTREVPLLCKGVREGQLDFGIIGLGYEDEYGADPLLHTSLKFEPLFTIPVAIVVRKDHPVLSSDVSAEDLLNYPIACETPAASVMRNMMKIAQDAKIIFDGPQILVDDYDFILRLVARSNFWTAVFAGNEKEIRKTGKYEFIWLDQMIPPMTLGLCSRKNWSKPLAAQMFIETLRNNVEGIATDIRY